MFECVYSNIFRPRKAVVSLYARNTKAAGRRILAASVCVCCSPCWNPVGTFNRVSPPQQQLFRRLSLELELRLRLRGFRRLRRPVQGTKKQRVLQKMTQNQQQLNRDYQSWVRSRFVTHTSIDILAHTNVVK